LFDSVCDVNLYSCNNYMELSNIEIEKLSQFFLETSSLKDKDLVEDLFCNGEKEKALRQYLSRQFSHHLNDDSEDTPVLDHILHRIHYHINTINAEERKGTYSKIIRRILSIAGIIILPVLIFWGTRGYFVTKTRQGTWVEIKAPAWTRARFSLPDGTSGWLNSNSSIKYNLDFINDRHVTLYGEVFFDVYSDTKHPFRVMTNDVALQVKGTRFNVSSYEDERTVEVVLEAGSLLFNDRDMEKSYAMKPNDLVTYDKTMKEFTTEVVQPQKYLAWTEGKLVFRNDPLDVICRRLARWYNVDVEVSVGSVENMRLRATFTDENLEEVLSLLKRSLPIDYKILNGTLNRDSKYSKKKVLIIPRDT
jgi:transmembrane sensor